MWRKFLFASALAVLPGIGTAAADDANPLAGLLTCAPAREDVAAVQVENVRFGATETYYWATGIVRLHLHDHSERAYSVSGRAVPLDQPLAHNDAQASFAYPGFRCVVQYPFITAVRNCRHNGLRTACDVALRIWGQFYSYTVSMSASVTVPPKPGASQGMLQ